MRRVMKKTSADGIEHIRDLRNNDSPRLEWIDDTHALKCERKKVLQAECTFMILRGMLVVAIEPRTLSNLYLDA